MRRIAPVMGAILLASSSTWAVPTPKTEAEMMKMADLVVDANCMNVICSGKPVDDGKKIVTTYISSLSPSKTYKGGLPNSFQVKGELWTWHGTPPTGGWHQEQIPKGWAGKLFLKKVSGSTYTKVWWNAMIEDKAKSTPVALPTCAAGDGGVPDAAVADTTQAKEGILDTLMPVHDSSQPVHDSGQPATDDDGGCSCRMQNGAGGQSVLAAGALLLLMFIARRRRR